MDTYGFLHKGYNKRTVVEKTESDTPFTLTADMSGQIFTNTGSTATLTFDLPTLIGATTRGLWYTFVKLTDDNVVLDAAAGDYIADSSSGGTITNSTAAETYAQITLIAVSDSMWAIEGAHGTWTTV